MPVIVIWSRQLKKANTKKRLLTDVVDTAVFEEEFQISTSMPCDEAGTPKKSKMSLLTVASDKQRGILGKAQLDLAKFSYDEYRIIRLEIEECKYEGAWIEVGLKGVPAARSTSNRDNISLNSSYRSSATNDSHAASAHQQSMNSTFSEAQYQELLTQFTDQKKQKRVAEQEKNKEIQQL